MLGSSSTPSIACGPSILIVGVLIVNRAFSAAPSGFLVSLIDSGNFPEPNKTSINCPKAAIVLVLVTFNYSGLKRTLLVLVYF